MHKLSAYIQTYDSLASLRKRILLHLNLQAASAAAGNGNGHRDDGNGNKRTNEELMLLLRVETSISKAELEDIFAPFKPPSKGSLEDRIKAKHPHLVAAIDELWMTGGTFNTSKEGHFVPRDAAITLLANRIANDVAVMDASMEFCDARCKIQVTQAAAARTSVTTETNRKNGKDAKLVVAVGEMEMELDKYKAYFDFESSFRYLRDHQVLAIRRGVNRKILKLGFDMDNDRAERIIGGVVRRKCKHQHPLYKDAIHDAWARLIRKRCTSRLWRKHCGLAEERSIDVFCDNLSKALLSPPANSVPGVLALDPGFKAGIKCAVLESSGGVIRLDTVNFIGGAREGGKRQLIVLLQQVRDMMLDTTTNTNTNEEVTIVLGNGHGTREARELVQEAANQCGVTIQVHLVSEAGASVWSVTEMAGMEFPEEKAAAIAAASIGRRYLNPLNELVKIPPKSLGLGMYQHDLPEKILDEKLATTSIDAVAAVGVDINSCSREILEKVPSLTAALCENIIKVRPLHRRKDLLQVARLGAKTFENCAAFIRVTNGDEPLDATLVHPESYDLARYLLNKLEWKLDDPTTVGTLLTKDEQREEWRELAKLAANEFQCPDDRISIVIEHLISSIISPDPRLRGADQGASERDVGLLSGCSSLPSNLSTVNDLRHALPVRNIIANVRNVVDFGAFVDFGGENDGLLHRSKFGPISLNSLLVGQEIGVDILGVSSTGKISLGVNGLNLPVENMDVKRSRQSQHNQSSSKRQRRK